MGRLFYTLSPHLEIDMMILHSIVTQDRRYQDESWEMKKEGSAEDPRILSRMYNVRQWNEGPSSKILAIIN